MKHEYNFKNDFIKPARLIWHDGPKKAPVSSEAKAAFAEIEGAHESLLLRQKLDKSRGERQLAETVMIYLLQTKAKFFSPELLDELANYEDTDIRAAIASATNSRIWAKTWDKLAKDKDRAVRLAVVKNDAAPANIVADMVNDEDSKVGLFAKYRLGI